MPAVWTAVVKPLRTERTATHRLEKVNSSHHQAIDRLGDDLEVEAWCATDDIIEQMRLRDYPFALAVQYHPERGESYAPLFADFVSRLSASTAKQRRSAAATDTVRAPKY